MKKNNQKVIGALVKNLNTKNKIIIGTVFISMLTAGTWLVINIGAMI